MVNAADLRDVCSRVVACCDAVIEEPGLATPRMALDVAMRDLENVIGLARVERAAPSIDKRRDECTCGGILTPQPARGAWPCPGCIENARRVLAAHDALHIDRSDPSVVVDSSISPAGRVEVHAHGRALALTLMEAEQLAADLEQKLRPFRQPHGPDCFCSSCV